VALNSPGGFAMSIARGPTLAVSFAVAMGLGASRVAAAPADALSACLARCDRARLSETNRATCRLDCEQDAATDPELIRSQIAAKTKTGTASASPSVRAPTPTPAPTGREACKAGCEADRTLSADDRATCKLECDLVDEPAATGHGTAAGPSAPPSGPIAMATGARPPAPTSLGVAPSSFLAMCLETCRKGPARTKATDQATCRLTCENTASVVDVALDAVPTGWFAPTLTMSAAPRPANVAVTATPTGTPSVAHHLPTTTATGTPPPVHHPPTTPATPGASCAAAKATCEGACAKVQATCERGCGKQKVETDRETCKLECGENQGLCAADCVGAHASCVNRGGR